MTTERNQPRHPPPLNDALNPVIERLKEIAARSGDALLSDGPVHADYKLLDLCAEALHHRRHAMEACEQFRALPAPYGNPRATAAELAERERLSAIEEEANHRAVQFSRAASKLKAATPAGIYAKALLVRSAQSIATILAMTLAQDLIKRAATEHVELPAMPPRTAEEEAQSWKVIARLQRATEELRRRNLMNAVYLAQQAAAGYGPLVDHFAELGRRYGHLLQAPPKPRLRVIDGGNALHAEPAEAPA